MIVFDHRGLGLSASATDTESDEWRMEHFADDVAGLMSDLCIQRCHVVGWSFGGMVAQHLAVREPSLVDKLVLLCCSLRGASNSAMGCSAHLWFNLLPFRRAAANRTLQKRLRCMTDAIFLSLVIQGWANPLQQGRTQYLHARSEAIDGGSTC